MFTRARSNEGGELGPTQIPGGLEEARLRGGDGLGVHGPRAGAAGHQLATVLQAKAGLGALAVPPDRRGELAGLGVSEQIRAVDPEPLQVGLHSPRGRPGLRGRIDAHEHDVGVGLGGRDDVASAGLEVAVVAKPAEGASDRGAGPVIGGVAGGE